MGPVGVDSAVRHLQNEPTTDFVQHPEVIVPSYKVITTLPKLFLLNTTLCGCHLEHLDSVLVKRVTMLIKRTIFVAGPRLV